MRCLALAAYKTPSDGGGGNVEIRSSPRFPAPKDAKKVFDSSQIPGEIMDLMVANTAVLKDNPNFAKALVGIWYETIAKMNEAAHRWQGGQGSHGKASGHRSRRLRQPARLDKTVRHGAGRRRLHRKQDRRIDHGPVRKFLFEKALLGKDAKSADVVGIEFADKTVQGDKANIKLRFDTTYMDAAAKGKL